MSGGGGAGAPAGGVVGLAAVPAAAESGSSNVTAVGTYMTFQACPVVPGNVLGVFKFEVLMLLCFALSFRFVQKRKRQRHLAQLQRIDSFV